MSRLSVPSSPDGARLAGEVPDRASIREFVADAFSQTTIARTVVISVPAPRISPGQILRALPDPDAVYWHPADGAALAGIGTAREIAVRGESRCEQLALVTGELFSDLKVLPYPDFAAPAPRLFGGLAFAAGPDRSPSRQRGGDLSGRLWQDFDDGRVALPRWCYRVDGEGASLNLALTGAAGERRQARVELDTLWNAFELPPVASEPTASPAAGVRVEHLDPKIWNRRVKRIRERIVAGEFHKVVTARTTTVTSEQPFDELDMMDRLAALYPRCTRFLFRRGKVAFMGATPETLFAKLGAEISTHALAGSVKIHPDLTAEEAGAALLRSPKNREEHAVVARQVIDSLEPLVERVGFGEEPRVMQLQNLLHLETPIHARLRPGSDVPALLAALHPTPAVAGLPRFEAVRWITANEPPRGWYSGPVGWLDAAGDGEFAVAIRCALLEGRRAHVFAGAGIMHDSDPPMEYGETAVKLQAMLRALGVET